MKTLLPVCTYNPTIIYAMLDAFTLLIKQSHITLDSVFFSPQDKNLNIIAIIKDDDEIAEATLYLTEAALNATYSPLGYSIDTLIFEYSDRVLIPNDFKKIF